MNNVSKLTKRKLVQAWMDEVALFAPGIKPEEIVLEAMVYAASHVDPAQAGRDWIHWQLCLVKDAVPTFPIISLDEAS